jgi:hypothetical protein
MTKTSLSAATWPSPRAQRAYSAPQSRLAANSILARDARRVRWHRHSCLPRGTKGLCAVARPQPQQIAEATLSLLSKILIANPRLTLHVNRIRISDLKISNRKFSTISHRVLPASDPFSPITRHSPALSRLSADEGSLVTAPLIETPRLKITISPVLSSASNFLIETKTAFSLIPSAKTRIQCGPEGEPA